MFLTISMRGRAFIRVCIGVARGRVRCRSSVVISSVVVVWWVYYFRGATNTAIRIIRLSSNLILAVSLRSICSGCCGRDRGGV